MLMAPGRSLRNDLLTTVEEIDMIIKRINEVVFVGRKGSNGQNDGNLIDFVALFKYKQDELEKLFNKIPEYQKRHDVIERLEAELNLRDEYIAQIQKALKDAETVLTTALFQANQKLKSIKQADYRRVNTEKLIQYAHKISQTNAVAAPLSWQQGDPDRPYPTEVELRRGWLGEQEKRRDPYSRPVVTDSATLFRPGGSPRTLASCLPPPYALSRQASSSPLLHTVVPPPSLVSASSSSVSSSAHQRQQSWSPIRIPYSSSPRLARSMIPSSPIGGPSSIPSTVRPSKRPTVRMTGIQPNQQQQQQHQQQQQQQQTGNDIDPMSSDSSSSSSGSDSPPPRS